VPARHYNVVQRTSIGEQDLAAEPQYIDSSATHRERRRRSDRRRGVVRSLVVGSFKQRRRGPRRSHDIGIASTDWHDAQWLAVVLLILVLSVADALLTLTLLDRGALEANPVMDALLRSGGREFAGVKIGLTAVGVVLLTVLARFRAFGRLRVSTVLYGVLGAYTVLVSYELWMLQSVLPSP